MLIVSFLSGFSAKNVFRFDLFVPILVAPLATVVYGGITVVLLLALGRPARWGEDLVRIILPSALINTLCIPIVYLVTRAIDRRTRREEITW
jgi:hypothetical protein